MKFASRIQPFVSVTRKEADAIGMENKLSNILKNKQIDSRMKSRLIEDGIARINNFKENNNLSADITEDVTSPPAQSIAQNTSELSNVQTAVETSPKMIKKKKNKSKTKKDSKKRIVSLTKARPRMRTSTPKKSSNPRQVLDVDTPVFTVSDRPSVPAQGESTHMRTDNLVFQGRGSTSKRLYIKKWK